MIKKKKKACRQRRYISNTRASKKGKQLKIKTKPQTLFFYFDSGQRRRGRNKTDTHNLVRQIGFVIPTEGSLFVKDPEAAATMNCDTA